MMISVCGKMVGIHDTMGDIGIGHDCTLRCTARLLGGAQRFSSNSPRFPDSGRARHVDKNMCGRSEIVASGVGARRAMIRLHLQLLSLHCWSHRSASPEVQSCESHIPAQAEAIPTGCPDCFGAAFSSVDPALAGW